jgi:SsrA-binding protein
VAQDDGRRVVIRNRKARHEYKILDTYEAGLVLEGAEVKSLREGNASFTDAFALVEDGEVWLRNLHIKPYESATHDEVDPTRTRKLLLHQSQIEKLAVETQQRGRTLVPLDIHFRGGYAKVQLALAEGKKHQDKREDLKREAMRREAEREIQRHKG